MADEVTTPGAAGSPVEGRVRPQRTEWTEVRLALRQEYGHPYTYNGVRCMDFSRHVYVGRAGALLLKAERQEKLLREVLEALPGLQAPNCLGMDLYQRIGAALGPNVEAKPETTREQ